jgi:hypothetical protein
MWKSLKVVFGTLQSSGRNQRELALENLALRQQLATLKFRGSRPRPIEGRYNLSPAAESSKQKWSVGSTTNTCE